MPPNEPS